MFKNNCSFCFVRKSQIETPKWNSVINFDFDFTKELELAERFSCKDNAKRIEKICFYEMTKRVWPTFSHQNGVWCDDETVKSHVVTPTKFLLGALF